MLVELWDLLQRIVLAAVRIAAQIPQGLQAPKDCHRSGRVQGCFQLLQSRNFLAVTPGIRPAWGTSPDDQKRITTPARAVQDGSDYLVIGRPIRDAMDPKAAAVQIAQEINLALTSES